MGNTPLWKKQKDIIDLLQQNVDAISTTISAQEEVLQKLVPLCKKSIGSKGIANKETTYDENKDDDKEMESLLNDMETIQNSMCRHSKGLKTFLHYLKEQSETEQCPDREKDEIQQWQEEKHLNQNKELPEENSLLKKELDEKTSKKSMQIVQKVNVQFLQKDHGELMGKVVSELKSWLQSIYSSGNIELIFIPVKMPSDAQNSMPLLVTCFNTSRLGPDAEAAISGIQDLTETALLIFHHKDVRLHVSHTPSETVLTSKTFASIGSIIDFVFLSKDGIYSCERNDASFDRLRQFINASAEKTASISWKFSKLWHKFMGK